MRKWSIIALALVTRLHAASCTYPVAPEPCLPGCVSDSCTLPTSPLHCLPGCGEIGVDVLYWQASHMRHQFAETNQQLLNANTRIQYMIRPDYQVGFRVWGAFHFKDCCNFIQASWTHFWSKDGQQLTPQNLFVFTNGLEQAVVVARGRLIIDYEKGAVRFGRHILQFSGARLYTFGAGQFVYLKAIRSTKGVEASGQVDTQNETTRMIGGGIALGFGAGWDFPCNFRLFGEAAVTGTIGCKSVLYNAAVVSPANVLTTNTKFTNPVGTVFLPGAEIKFGAKGWRDCCFNRFVPFRIVGEIGVDFTYYHNAFNFRQPTISTLSIFNEDAVFFGPYASLSVRF